MSSFLFPVFDFPHSIESDLDGVFLFELIYGPLDDVCVERGIRPLKAFVVEWDLGVQEEGEVPLPGMFDIGVALSSVDRLLEVLDVDQKRQIRGVSISDVRQELLHLKDTLERGRLHTEKFCLAIG